MGDQLISYLWRYKTLFMKYLLSLLLSLLNICVFSQGRGSYYVTNSDDTVTADIRIYTNIRGKTDLSMLSKSIIVEGVSETKKLKPADIKAFVITDFDSVYKFVSLPGEKSRFFHEVVSGKLSFYKLYTPGNTLPVMVKDGKLVYLNVINPKKRITELIADCPALLKEWDEGEKYTIRDREEIAQAYNACWE